MRRSSSRIDVRIHAGIARSHMPSSHVVDVLTDMLQRSRARGAAFSHSTIRGRSGSRFDAVPGLAVHAIVEGELHLWTDGEAERLLGGDIVLVRGGVDHRSPPRPAAPASRCASTWPTARVGPRRFVRGEARRALGVLLRRLRLRGRHLRPAARPAARDRARCAPRRAARCAPRWTCWRARCSTTSPASRRCSTACSTSRSSRSCASTSPPRATEAPAWFRASRDPELGPVLRALHADPARRWTVEELADRAALSRAAFARRFTARWASRRSPTSTAGGWRWRANACATPTTGSPRSPTPSATRRSSRSPRPSSATTASPPAAGATARSREPKARAEA